jgi:deazaflavin-dependent oxidoreductase (nitroreductase family)
VDARLKVVIPPRRASRIRRAYAALATTRWARVISRRINWKLDLLLLRISKGRVSTTLMFRAAVLETRGARTGRTRRNAAIYFNDGDRVVIVASNAGAPRHPSWFHNIRAHPQVTFGGVPMLASVVDDEREHQRLAELSDRVFPAFATYRREAAQSGRVVPIVLLISAT